MIELIVIFFGGLILGLILGKVLSFRFRKMDGKLYVNDDDSQQIKWKMLMESTPKDIINKKYVVFEVMK